MTPAERVAKEFERLCKLGHKQIRNLSQAERILYYIVVARCEADMEGFQSVYEQALSFDEMKVLIDGLKKLGHARVAAEYARGLELLHQDGFYEHHNWRRLSEGVAQEICAIGEHVDGELWALDEKLVAMLDDHSADEPVK